MANSRSSRVYIWVFLIDENFKLQAPVPFKLDVSKQSDIDDMAAVAARELGLNRTFTRILKIVDPIIYKHSYTTRSASQLSDSNMFTAPRSLPQLLAQLKAGNKQFVEYPDIMTTVGDHFEDRPGMIQALVKHPLLAPLDKKRKREESSKTQDQDTAPIVEHLENIAKGSPPSEVLGEHGVKLRKDILLGRPAGQFALPVALYNQHLAQLQFKLSKLDTSSNESNALFQDVGSYFEVSRQFFEAAIDDHVTEDSRWIASKSYFETLFGHDLIEQFPIPRAGINAVSTARADACVVVTTFDYKDTDGKDRRVQIPHTFFEFKKEKGAGNPIAQCAKAYAESNYGYRGHPFFLSTSFPAIFVALDGHSLDISISVSLEYIVVDNILQLDLRDSIQRTETIQQLARIASALLECSKALDREYRKLAAQGELRHPLQPCFPQPTLHPLDDLDSPLPELKFRGRLSRTNQLVERLRRPTPEDMRSLLVANAVEGADSPMVVKFVDNYGKEAHEILANANLAPKLYHCRRALGGVLMVIMEHLEGWCTMVQFKKGELAQSVFEDIEKALEELNRNGYVHGDLRAVNIMIDAAKQHAKIVDFDWAAKEGEGRYPLSINKAELESEWHPDVCGGGAMIAEHDEYALNQVLKLKY